MQFSDLIKNNPSKNFTLNLKWKIKDGKDIPCKYTQKLQNQYWHKKLKFITSNIIRDKEEYHIMIREIISLRRHANLKYVFIWKQSIKIHEAKAVRNEKRNGQMYNTHGNFNIIFSVKSAMTENLQWQRQLDHHHQVVLIGCYKIYLAQIA